MATFTSDKSKTTFEGDDKATKEYALTHAKLKHQRDLLKLSIFGIIAVILTIKGEYIASLPKLIAGLF